MNTKLLAADIVALCTAKEYGWNNDRYISETPKNLDGDTYRWAKVEIYPNEAVGGQICCYFEFYRCKNPIITAENTKDDGSIYTPMKADKAKWDLECLILKNHLGL